jgi:type 1 glutamine amidotransferase
MVSRTRPACHENRRTVPLACARAGGGGRVFKSSSGRAAGEPDALEARAIVTRGAVRAARASE